MNKTLFLIGVAALLATSCSTFYQGVITVTEVRDDALRELAQLNKRGLITPEQDAKIAAADLAYLQAARVAERALVAYQNGGDRKAFVAALVGVKAAVGEILALLNPLNVNETQRLESKLAKASKP